MTNNLLVTPYSDILTKLISSIMRAQGIILESLAEGFSVEKIDDQAINRHFSWLSLHSAGGGENRHLFDGSPDGSTSPLLSRSLKEKNLIPEKLRSIFESGGSVPLENIAWIEKYSRKEATRISRIIKNEMLLAAVLPKQLKAKTGKTQYSMSVPSPLRIAELILTVPESPGSREYAFLALRNFLVGGINRNLKSGNFSKFTEEKLAESFDSIETSRRTRYFSKGRDKIPASSPSSFDRFLREFLGLKGFYDYWFDSPGASIKYFTRGIFSLLDQKLGKIKIYEFTPRANLERLPDISDISNQVFGLPLPIRGADIVFRGGLKFPSRKGLVVVMHGGPGTGKTSLALGIGASLAGFGIDTLFFSAEEAEVDLRVRATSSVPSTFHRLSFYPSNSKKWLEILKFNLSRGESSGHQYPLSQFQVYFEEIKNRLSLSPAPANSNKFGIYSPCRLVVVLDGLHDLVNRSMSKGQGEPQLLSEQFHGFVEKCKKLEALVILTAGSNWQFGAELDYLVDTAIHLTHDTAPSDGGKPERLLNLTKARHQSCSAGTHSFQIAGERGVRFTPQINFCLDMASIWATRLSDSNLEKRTLRRVATKGDWSQIKPKPKDFEDYPGVRIFGSSNIFINGNGSSGKAGMALKIAASPYFDSKSGEMLDTKERILIISFLYPKDYYSHVHKKVCTIRNREYSSNSFENRFSRIDVVQFYPGFLRPASLFNRIRWQLDEAELNGDPFTTVLLDGLHNVFIQFPQLEKNQIVWPQLYSMLRQKALSIITTHTVLMYSAIADDGLQRNVDIDDYRSDPLRHALVQKTDFSFEVDPVASEFENTSSAKEYLVHALSAIGQPLPNAMNRLCWHREESFFYDGGKKKITGRQIDDKQYPQVKREEAKQ